MFRNLPYPTEFVNPSKKNTRHSKYYGKNSYESLEICDRIVVDEFEDKKKTQKIKETIWHGLQRKGFTGD